MVNVNRLAVFHAVALEGSVSKDDQPNPFNTMHALFGLTDDQWSGLAWCLCIAAVFILGLCGWYKGRRWIAPFLITIPAIAISSFIDPADPAAAWIIAAPFVVAFFYLVAAVGFGIHRVVRTIWRFVRTRG